MRETTSEITLQACLLFFKAVIQYNRGWYNGQSDKTGNVLHFERIIYSCIPSISCPNECHLKFGYVGQICQIGYNRVHPWLINMANEKLLFVTVTKHKWSPDCKEQEVRWGFLQHSGEQPELLIRLIMNQGSSQILHYYTSKQKTKGWAQTSTSFHFTTFQLFNVHPFIFCFEV